MMSLKGWLAGTAVLLLFVFPLHARTGDVVAGESPQDSLIISTPSDVVDTLAAEFSAEREDIGISGEEIPPETEMTVESEEREDTATVDPEAPPPADTVATKDYPRYTPGEYLYAGVPRYTLTGDLPYRSTHIRPVPTAVIGTAVAGTIAAIHFYQQDAWWSDRRQDFHFTVDWGYAAQADKLGHMFAGYLTSYVGYESLVASGFSPDVAGWFGPLLGLGFQTYVEIEDGFSPFGFDPTDQYANTFGPLFFSLQHYVPVMQNFKFKWSYWPNEEYQEGVRSGHETIIIDDYNGQTMWFSTKVGNLLPESLGWPKWLRLAFGYGTYNVDRINERNEVLAPGRRFFVALDYDLVELLPDLGTFGNWLVQTADYLRWPAPALQIEPEVKFYLAWPVHF